MNQTLEYLLLRNTLTLKNMPNLRAAQLERARENVAAGLELGLGAEESVRMAMEDFETPAEKLAAAELGWNAAWYINFIMSLLGR
jgi:hypothetical protein